MEQKEPRRQKSRTEMYQKIELWYQSGQSKKAFCELAGLRVHVFDYWRKQYEQQKAEDSPSAGFWEVPGVGSTACSSLRVVYPNGLVLEFSHLPQSTYLQSLLRW